MPIKVQNELPARAILESENIFVMDEKRALSQDIRPLQLVILNLMPLKEETELQILRALSNTPLQVDCTFLMLSTHVSKNTSASHLNKFYVSFDSIKKKKFDGMIITGAPVENMEFEEVNYWEELSGIMEWTKTHVTSTIHICWGAQAALNYFYDIPKYSLPAKKFGIYSHQVEKKDHVLMRGFDEAFYCPHSRHTEVRAEDIRQVDDLEILAESAGAGPHIIADKSGRRIFLTGHFEYDADSLAKEFYRDLDKGLPIQLPYGYFPEDDPKQTPLMRWKAHANLFYSNWLNYFVYQETPYHINDIQA